MIERITIQNAIFYEKAKEIIKKSNPTSKWTLDSGVIKPSISGAAFVSDGRVWANKKHNKLKPIRDSYIQFDILPALLNKVVEQRNPNALIDASHQIDDEYGIKRSSWIIKEVLFVKTINTPYSSQYLKCLNWGHDLNNFKMKKESNSKGHGKGNQPTKISFNGGNKGNCLNISITTDPFGTESLRLELFVRSRALKRYYDNNLSAYKDIEKLEDSIWKMYIEALSGTADYYSYRAAEIIIDEKIAKASDRVKLESILKGVARYKGIEPYLLHVSKGDVEYNDLYKFASIQTLKRYVKILQDELNINPIVISRRDSEIIKAATIPNLAKQMDIASDINSIRVLEPSERKRKALNGIDVEVRPYDGPEDDSKEEVYYSDDYWEIFSKKTEE